MIGKLIFLYTIVYVAGQFYPAPCFQNPPTLVASAPNIPMYASPCANTLPGPIVALPYEFPTQAPVANIPTPFLPAPALVPNVPTIIQTTMPCPELAMPNAILLPETRIPQPVGCFEPSVTPCGTIAEFPIGNPFLPVASPVSALMPFSPLLPPASPCGCRCQYLRKIPIPPPCI